MKLEYRNSSRCDFGSYALLLVGLIFIWASVITNHTDCDESGLECEPWLLAVGFCLGVCAGVTGSYLLIKNFKWGSALDLQQHQLIWWDTRESAETRRLSLREIARIKVQADGGSETVLFYNSLGTPLIIPSDEIFPHPYQCWAHDVAARYAHITVEVEIWLFSQRYNVVVKQSPPIPAYAHCCV